MTEQDLYERLKKIQEPKGYFFNKDLDGSFRPAQGSSPQ